LHAAAQRSGTLTASPIARLPHLQRPCLLRCREESRRDLGASIAVAHLAEPAHRPIPLTLAALASISRRPPPLSRFWNLQILSLTRRAPSLRASSATPASALVAPALGARDAPSRWRIVHLQAHALSRQSAMHRRASAVRNDAAASQEATCTRKRLAARWVEALACTAHLFLQRLAHGLFVLVQSRSPLLCVTEPACGAEEQVSVRLSQSRGLSQAGAGPGRGGQETWQAVPSLWPRILRHVPALARQTSSANGTETSGHQQKTTESAEP
jgi:hypothetical protein